MAVEDDDDRATFFETDEHGVAATYRDSEAFETTGAATSETVNGIFGNGFLEVQDIETSRPAFTCVEADIPNAKEGDELDIEDVTYKVVGVQPDNAGMLTLILQKRAS